MKTRKLITCTDDFQARLIQGALENEGIPSALHNENTSNVLRGFVVNVSGVDIFVYEDDYEAAMALLERNQMVPEQLKYCPQCGSADIRLRLKRGKRFLRDIARDSCHYGSYFIGLHNLPPLVPLRRGCPPSLLK